ncbi:unnamed protein product [Schistosoma turkestanicum]|nr:unnamed protein product [Schistosoma turkestanicum]
MSLGSQACILKLKEEIYLLHEVVERVNKRANMKSAYSWKFPGKSAFETEIRSVLSKCNFSTSSKPSNAILHVFLLEMIIDRCLLIFQILSHLCKPVCHFLGSSYENSNSLSSCVNEHVSLVFNLLSLISVSTKRNKIADAQCVEDHQETFHEVDRFVESKLAAEAINWVTEVERFYNSSSQVPSTLTSKNFELETRSQETQTYVSKNLDGNFSQLFLSTIQVLSRCLVKPMDEYNLPSEIGRFIYEVKNSEDQHEWKVDGSKSLSYFLERDITRLVNYLETNSSSIKIMEEQINLMKKENVKLSKEMLDKQDNFNSSQEKLSKEIKKLNKKNSDLMKENTNIKTEVENLNNVIKNKESRILELENQVEIMKNNMENFQKLCVDTVELNEVDLLSKPSCIVESCLLELRHKLENTTNECNRISKLLEMKEMENQNMNTQFSMLTAKHEKLSTRINQLTDINERFEKEIVLKDNSIKCLNSELTSSNKKLNELENSLHDMKNMLTEKEKVHKSAELNLEHVKSENIELCEKLNKLNEDLLNMAQYPDLNGPITFENDNNDKSVDEELKGQIQANELRITLLMEQTKRLRNALFVINDQRQSMNYKNNNNDDENQLMNKDTELLSPKIDHLLLGVHDDDDNNAPSIIHSNASSDNRLVDEDNYRARQKTYTKPSIISNEVNGNHSSVQLWSGPSITRKKSSRPQSKRKK